MKKYNLQNIVNWTDKRVCAFYRSQVQTHNLICPIEMDRKE